MGFISTRDGTKIFYRDWGSGQPILFSHAWPLSSESWDAQMRFVASNGFRAIAYDRRGHGRSDQPWDGNDIDGYADDLADLVEALDLSDIALVTHSMGGSEAARYVRRHGNGRLARIAMAGAAMPLMLKSSANPDGVPIDVFDYLRSGVAERRSAFLKEVAISFYGFNRDGVEVDAGLVESFWLWGIQASPKSLYDCIRMFSEVDYSDDLGAIDVPVLFVHGDDDQMAPIALSAHRAVKRVGKGRLSVYEGASHGIPQTHAERFNADILSFIRG